MGDVIISTSIIKQIINYHKNKDCYLITDHLYENIFSGWNGLSVHPLNRNSLMDLVGAACWIRKNRFSRVYDLQSNDKTRLLCAVSGIRGKIGNHPIYPYNIHPDTVYRKDYHPYLRLQETARVAGIPVTSEVPYLLINNKDADHVKKWLIDNQLTEKKFVLLHAGASPTHPEKCWPWYNLLANKLVQSGLGVVWTGTKNEHEKTRMLMENTGVNACGEFNIVELAELGKHAAFAVTNDSGPMHVLSASGIPVYALFGPTNPRVHHAIGQEKNVISARVSSAENENFIKTPIDAISVEQVVNRITADGLINK